MVGQIVRSVAGRDKESFLVIIAKSNGKVLVCDGKARPLSRPKLKNLKHLVLINDFLSETQMLSDKSLRKALSAYKRAKEEK